MGWLDDREAYIQAHRDDFAEVLGEQASVVPSLWQQLGQPIAVSAIYDRSRWDQSLQDRLYLRARLTAIDFGTLLAADLGGELDPAEMDGFLASTSGLSAQHVNAATEDQLQAALASEDPEAGLGGVFELLLGSRLALLAGSSFITAANFGRHTGAEQSGAKTKTWKVNSSNPRSLHVAVSGETVSLDVNFSNGMRWPGDPRGGAAEVADCKCSVVFKK